MEAETRERVEVADLTMTFNPAEFWPDAQACPDWPVLDVHDPGNWMRGRRPAVERLERLQAMLSGDHAVRSPTAAEVERSKAEHFQQLDNPRVSPNVRWYQIGFTGYGPRRANDQRAADHIVEALHLRGYLRKLDEQDAQRAERAKADETAHQRRYVDSYTASLPGKLKQLDELAPAIARHKQRLEDEAAVQRASNIKQEVRHGYAEARRAASALGVDMPEEPIIPE